MAAHKGTVQHRECNPANEAALAGALALANLFGNCVEAFGLIHPAHRWEKEEQLLLSRLGIQQARLLIWGHIVGVSSPPKSVTDRAVPKHPSSVYPDLTEPTFFGPRDGRLDESETRTTIEDALSAIIDRSSHNTREEMMAKYGLKPPKRVSSEHHQPPLDTNRLEAFREKYELLQEVGETYAQISTRRQNSIVQTSWQVADYTRFASFIRLTQEKVDFLISLMGVKEGVDRGMRMDIRAFGWHLTNDRVRTALDVSKLRLIQEACRNEYPEYVEATQQALDNIDREARENAMTYRPFAAPAAAAVKPAAHVNGAGEHDKHKRAGLFGMFKGLRRPRDDVKVRRRSAFDSGFSPDQGPERSHSDAGPARPAAEGDDGSGAALEPVRSKSVGAILDAPINSLEEEMIKMRLEKMNTNTSAQGSPDAADAMAGVVSRHDQYHGIARTATKDLRQ